VWFENTTSFRLVISATVPHPQLSIIIPVRDDAQQLERLLRLLTSAPGVIGSSAEIVVVDGGSQDGSRRIASEFGVRVLRAPAGRGLQLNAGCRSASGQLLWLLHADSQPSVAALDRMCADPGIEWGRFDVCFDDDSPLMRLTAKMMNGRSRLTGICTGDQGIFLHRRLLALIGGIPEIPLMEDIELSLRLSQLCRPICLPMTVQTSARRWRRDGWGRTVWAMWRFRFRYWLGAPAGELACEYYPTGPDA
jgi:rSAM/selenodomain-associated transferase 2